MSERAVSDWMQFFRDIAVEHLARHPRVLGGEGCVVEIDESLFARRKYNRGRHVVPQWVFGGYCRRSGLGFLIPVPDRQADTLLPIVADFIAPGTIIYSDCWPAYNRIPAIPERNYGHMVVNHSQHFVDPETGVHTNGVEGMWSRAKSKVKAMNGTARSLVFEYAAEFMFRQEFQRDILHALWATIAELYPLGDVFDELAELRREAGIEDQESE